MIFNLSAVPIVFAQATRVEVVAPTGDIAVPTQFNVDITVVDVTDLYAWQIKLYYNPAVLRWINATYPPGHVFEGKPLFSVFPFNGSDYGDGGTYILFYASLLGSQPGIDGSGTLCRISFEAKAVGSSTLIFSRPLGGWGSDTWLMDPDDVITSFPSIVFTVVERDASNPVTVVGEDTRPSSAISLNTDKSVMFLGDSAVISGVVNVTVPDGTLVYIEYWNYSEIWIKWLPVTTVTTTGSQYSYTWTPKEGGLIGIRSRWTGNSAYKPATSEEKTIAISALGPHDLNGDGKIDGKDIAVVAQAFGSYPGHPRWNPQADLNQDDKIEGKDIALVGRNFGKTYHKIPAYLKMFPDVIIKPTVLGDSIVGKPAAFFEVRLLINNVDPRDFLICAQFNMTFNATLLRVDQVFEGSFMNNPAWAPYGTMLLWHEDPGSLVGYVLILPNGTSGEWDMTQFPSGDGLLATIRFEAIYQSEISYDTSNLLLSGVYGEFFVSANETAIPYGPPISGSYIIYGPDY
jgi:hypothetical protein